MCEWICLIELINEGKDLNARETKMSGLQMILNFVVRRRGNSDRLMTFLASRPFRFGPGTIRKVIKRFRQEIITDRFQYPSVINNGYLHIERMIEIIQSRSIDVKVVLDIGAASGETCKKFAESFPYAKVYAFEPIKSTFQKLVDNTKAITSISAFNLGLGSKQATVSINITGRVTSSSILATNENEFFTEPEPFRIVSTEEIFIDTLDQRMNGEAAVQLIKMDVQGYELEVLKGGVETLKRTSFVLLELQNHQIYQGAPQYFEIDTFLRENGFELFDMIPSIRVNMQIKEFDAIYINKLLAG